MKFLIAGLGSIGQRHARNLRALRGEGVELWSYRVRGRPEVLTSDLKVKAGADLAQEYGLRVFPGFDEALAAGPDAVIIGTPNHLHTTLAQRAAEAGCHLFIEKPVAHELAGLAALARTVREKSLVCFVAYQLRFHPGFEKLQQWLAEGVVGHLIGGRMIFGEYLPDWHKYEDYRGYHAARRDQGGGVLISQIHDLDLLYALFGCPRRLCCFGGQLTDLEIDVEDTASLLLEFEHQGRRFPLHLHQDYAQKPPARSCELIGTRGRIVWDYCAAELRWVRPDGGVELESFRDFPRNELFLREIAHFLDCVEKGVRPRVTLEEGIDSLRMALAAHESLRTGQVVDQLPAWQTNGGSNKV